MRPDPARSFAALAALAAAFAFPAASPGPALAQAPELTLQGGWSSGPGEGGVDAETGWGLVRLGWGDRIQLRAEIPWLSLDGGGARTPGGLGPVSPTAPRGNGGGGNGPSPGPGPGGGPSPLTLGAAAEGADAEPSSASGLGDLRLAASYRLAGGGAKLYRLDLGAAVKVPTADEEEGLGTGETDVRLGVSGEYRFWSLTLFGGLGYNWMGDPAGLELEDVPDVYVGLESLPLGDRVLISGWLEGHPEIEPGTGDYAAVGVGARTLGRVRFELLAAAGLTDASEDFSIALGVSFGLRPPVAGPGGARR